MDHIEKNIFNTLIKEGDVIYDIGAHVGENSIYFSILNAGIIYAFEPSNFNFNKLKINTEKYSNIKCFDVAINDKEYECVTKFKDCAHGCDDPMQPIKYVRIMDFIKSNNLKFPNLIKIDIEGMESIILNDFTFLFENIRPIVELEIHAASKNSSQDYENNPHWRWIDQGGFVFNDLKLYNYMMLDCFFNKISYDVDYNPNVGDHKHVILIPEEKMSNYNL